MVKQAASDAADDDIHLPLDRREYERRQRKLPRELGAHVTARVHIGCAEVVTRVSIEQLGRDLREHELAAANQSGARETLECATALFGRRSVVADRLIRYRRRDLVHEDVDRLDRVRLPLGESDRRNAAFLAATYRAAFAIQRP